MMLLTNFTGAQVCTLLELGLGGLTGTKFFVILAETSYHSVREQVFIFHLQLHLPPSNF